MNTLLVVLFKKNPNESQTLLSILSHLQSADSNSIKEYKLVVWDNSPIEQRDNVQKLFESIKTLQLIYIHTPQNTPLSKLYNKTITTQASSGYITLLDQDTTLPTLYFDILKSAQNKDWKLILPKIICKEILVSPARRFISRGIRVKEILSGPHSSKSMVAINSGMSIHHEVFRTIKYDERLNFYGTDNYFMRNYEKFFSTVFVLDIEIQHELAEMEIKPIEWIRANQLEKWRALKITFDNSIIEIIFTAIYVALAKIRSKLSSKNY